MKLNPKQSLVYQTVCVDRVRRVVLVSGRRFGKTHLALACLLTGASEENKSKNWYVGPTYKQCKDIAWDILKDICPREWVKKINETDLLIELINGSKIYLKGAEKPDSLRGAGLHMAIFDEYQMIDPYAWAVIQPSLATTGGQTMFIGTPMGFNHFYEMYIKYMHSEDPNETSFLYKTIDGGYVPVEEIEIARREYDERIFRQEYEASFESLEGRVYYSFDRNLNVSAEAQDNGGDIFIGMDFNVNPMTAVIGCRVGDQLHIFDEIILRDSNTQEMAQEIKNKYGYLKSYGNDHYQFLRDTGRDEQVPYRKVRVFPDPTGRSRKTSANLGETDLTILKRMGFEVYAPASAYGVIDRINTVNHLLCNAAGERNIYINPKCAGLIKCLDGLTYKEGTNQPDKSGGLDHETDALGYLVMGEFPVLRPKTKFGQLYG